MSNIIDKIKKLQKMLTYHAYLYHTLDTPIISDIKYDKLIKKLYNLEKISNQSIDTNSPTKKIGGNLLSTFNKCNHLTPMLSLANIFNTNQLYKFIKKIKNYLNDTFKLSFCCELKIDGLALNLIYKNGVLIKALTRGNGYIGEDVTTNAREIDSIPLTLQGNKFPKLIEIRGEVFVSKSFFKKFNNIEQNKNKKIFCSPRNFAAGSLRQINPKITKSRKLLFVCHSYGLIQGISKQINLLNHFNNLNKLKKWGLSISKYNTICNSLEDICYFFKKIENIKDLLDFDIDGIVIKVNSIPLRKKIGCTVNYPKWATAFKFHAEKKITKLIGVHFQVGRTGLITPVATLTPIKLSGATIKSVSLHNKSEMEKLNIYIGANVLIRRSGDIIPYIIKVIPSNNVSIKTNQILFPNTCPICNSVIQHTLNNKRSRCTGKTKCHSQIQKSIRHFFSISAIHVEGIGNKLISKLIDHGVTNIIQIYKLNMQQLDNIKHIGKKFAAKLIQKLNSSKHVTLSRLIYALGIPTVGITISKNIATYFNSVENFLKSNKNELQSIKNVGKLVSTNIYNYIKTKKNVEFVYSLINTIGFIIKSDMNSINIKNNIFSNKTIVITGKIHYYTRKELTTILLELGGVINKYVSKNTDMVIVGDSPGINYKKALDLDINIIEEHQLINII